MKRVMNALLLILIASFVMTTTGCMNRLKVPAGYVAIKVNMYGGDKGVQNEELQPGKYWLSTFNEEAFLFPTFTQNYVWTQDKDEGSPNDESFSFQTREGLAVGADIGIAYHIEPTMVNVVFQKYRKGVKEITDVNLRNYVRDAINIQSSTMAVAELYGPGKERFILAVEASVREQVGVFGIVLEKLSVIGRFRLPKTVTASIDNKIKATQQAEQRENEIREAQAAAKKMIAQAEGEKQSVILKAQGEAQALKLRNSALTDRLIAYEAIQKWNGIMPAVTGSGALPFLNMDMSKLSKR